MRTSSTLIAGLLAALWCPRAAAQETPRVSLEFKGLVLMNSVHTSRRTNNVDIPQFVLRPGAADSLGDGGGVGMSVRQTRLGVTAFWPDVAGGEMRAEVDADFYGGQQQSNFGDLFALFHLRRAIAELSWERGSVMVGQEVPLISEYNPSSFATVGLSGFASSGNLWLWIPQIRGALHIMRQGSARLSLEGAVMAPTTNEAAGELLTQPDRAEQSERPAVEGRAIFRWGGGARAGDISVGAHAGWLATTGDSLVRSQAIAVAARIPLWPGAHLVGEWFDGEALAGLGGGGIGQNLTGDEPIPTAGGWGQLVWQPTSAFAVSSGFGQDDPDDAFLGPAGRLRNRTIMGNVQITPGPFVVALEYRSITTTYAQGDARAGHLNLALGVRF